MIKTSINESRPTLKDVALKSGLSLRTVKKVISGQEFVQPETRKRVLDAVNELNYRKNTIASSLAKSKKTNIAIVYSETTKTYFPETKHGFLRCAEEYRDFGIAIDFKKTNSREYEDQIAILKAIQEDPSIDGVVIQPMSKTKLNPYIDEVVEAGKPVITFGADATTDSKLCYIGPNAYKSGRIGAQILANYIGKRGNVVIISDNSEHMQSVDRVRGFLDRVTEHYPNLQITNLNLPQNETLYYEMVKTLVTQESIQGIFCTDANSYIAGEVLRDLKRHDIAIVGFDISGVAVDLMKGGYLKVIIEQNPEFISYSALKTMFNYLYYGKKPELISYTDLSILTSECL